MNDDLNILSTHNNNLIIGSPGPPLTFGNKGMYYNESVTIEFAEWIVLFHYTPYPIYNNGEPKIQWCQDEVDLTKFYTTEELFNKFINNKYNIDETA